MVGIMSLFDIRPSKRQVKFRDDLSQASDNPDEFSEGSFGGSFETASYYDGYACPTEFTNCSQIVASDRSSYTRYSGTSKRFTRDSSERSVFASFQAGNEVFSRDDRHGSFTRRTGDSDTRDTISITSTDSGASIESESRMRRKRHTDSSHRSFAEERLIRKYAAIIIQSQVRGMISRKQTRDFIHQRYARWEAAAVIIQSQVRGVLARKRLKKVIKNEVGFKKTKQLNFRGLFRSKKADSENREETVSKPPEKQIKEIPKKKIGLQPNKQAEPMKNHEELAPTSSSIDLKITNVVHDAAQKIEQAENETPTTPIQSVEMGMQARAKSGKILDDSEEKRDRERISQLAGELTDEHFFFDYFCSALNFSKVNYEDNVLEAYGVEGKHVQDYTDPYLVHLKPKNIIDNREEAEEYGRFLEAERESQESFEEAEEPVRYQVGVMPEDKDVSNLMYEEDWEVKQAASKLLQDQMRTVASIVIQAYVRGFLVKRKYTKMKADHKLEEIKKEALIVAANKKRDEMRKRQTYRQLAHDDKFYTGILEDGEHVDSDPLLRILNANLNRKVANLESDKSPSTVNYNPTLSTSDREESTKHKMAGDTTKKTELKKKRRTREKSTKDEMAGDKTEKHGLTKKRTKQKSAEDKIAGDKTEKTALKMKPMKGKLRDKKEAKTTEKVESKEKRVKQKLVYDAKKRKHNKRGNVKKKSGPITIIDRKSGAKVF